MKHRVLFRKIFTVVTALAVVISFASYSASSLTVTEASTQSELEQRLKEIEAEQKEIDKKIKSTKDDIAKEKENQEAIDEQIEATEEYIRTLVDLISDYTSQIESLEDEIAALEGEIEIQSLKIEAKEQEIEENTELYGKRLRAIYLSGNDSVASIVLGSTDFFDMLMKIELVKRVSKNDAQLIQSMLDTAAEYEADKLELENEVAALEETVEITEGKKTEQEDLQAQWNDKLVELQDLLSQSKKAIAALKDKEDAYEDDKEALDKEADKLEKEIQDIIRKASRAQYMGDLPEGTFLWPCPGHYTITSKYGMRSGRMHRGIDISDGSIHGAEICAANSGEVIFVNNSCTHNYGKKKSCGCGSGFGNYCIIDHGGGYTTVYGHAEKIIVKVGQKVSTGDVLGYVGSTGDSTGWHLHFETRIDGDRVDPQGSKVNLIVK